MNEIMAYIGSNRRRVTVGYKLPDGKMQRVHRKIEGTDKAAIEEAIDDIKSLGVKEVVIEIYRPNGSAEKLCKTFVLPNNGSRTTLGSTPTLFGDSLPPRKDLTPKPTTPRPQQTPRAMEHNSWKDYALKTEQEKVAKLEAEVRRLAAKNETLDKSVRDFEKEMIRKDNELEKLQSQIENKSGLSGFFEKAAESKESMQVLSGVVARIFNLPMEGQALNAPPDANAHPQTETYVANIKAWLYKMPLDVQDQFYQLVYRISNSPNPSPSMNEIINLIDNGTILKRTA